jgi:hypothetical protein
MSTEPAQVRDLPAGSPLYVFPTGERVDHAGEQKASKIGNFLSAGVAWQES